LLDDFFTNYIPFSTLNKRASIRLPLGAPIIEPSRNIMVFCGRTVGSRVRVNVDDFSLGTSSYISTCGLNNTDTEQTVVNVTCNGLTPTRVGTNASETLIGTNCVNVVHGLGGNNRIEGKKANDLLCGGLGNDQLYDQSDADRLLGEAGNDQLLCADGRDALDGGSKQDVCNGGAPRTGDTAVKCGSVKNVP
jgi:Ca2+-binding RTX toxin-like protein